MKRILTALVLMPVFIYLVALSPQWLFIVAVAGVSSLCFREYARLVGLHGIEKPGLFGYAAGIALILLPRPEAAFAVLIAVLALSLSIRIFDLKNSLPYAGALVLGVLYTFGTLRCAVDLRAISVWWALLALSLNWAGDIVALYVGRAIGKHKMSPRVSPNKSWEGAFASVISSMAYTAVYVPRLLPEVPVMEAVLIAAAGNIAGQFGDLAESAIKRGAGVKDSGNLLPGHGGWLDRVDSSLFALPVIYFLVANLKLHL